MYMYTYIHDINRWLIYDRADGWRDNACNHGGVVAVIKTVEVTEAVLEVVMVKTVST